MTRRRVGWIVAVLGVGLGAFGGYTLLPAFRSKGGTPNIWCARQLLRAVSAYVDDLEVRGSGSRFPQTLRDLMPEYLRPQDYEAFGFFRDRSTGQKLDWLYFPPPDDKVPSADWILLAGPRTETGWQNRARGKVPFMHWGGDGGYLPEAEFQRLLALQQGAGR